jgi:hypothetical protein
MRKIEFTNFELRIGRGQGNRYPVVVAKSPAGEASGTFVMPFSAGKVERTKTLVELAMLRSRERTRAALEGPMRDLRVFGGELFEALFSDRVRSCYDSSLRIAISQGKGLRLKLNIEPTELACLPWEFLYDKETRKFLALSIRTLLVRYLDVGYSARPLLVQPPMHLLVVIASPSEFTPLDIERERYRIQTALQEREEQGLITLDFLENATLPMLQQRLREADYHILHFIGHDGFDEESQQGVLFLEDEWKNAKRVSGRQLGGLLGDHFPLRLVVLNACEGGRLSSQAPGEYDHFSGMAENLIREGIPAVAAMQFPVTDEAAVIFSRELYQAVADDYPVDAAVAEARKRIEYTLRNTVEWAAPVLFMHAPDGMLFRVPPRALAEARDKQIARLYGEAREAMAAEQWRQAIALLERVLALDPDHPAALTSLTTAQIELTRGEGAVHPWDLIKGLWHYVQQRWSLLRSEAERPAVQASFIELDARRLEHCAEVRAIGQAHRNLAAGELEGPASALLRSFSRISQDVDAALRQGGTYNQRLALGAIEDRLDSLFRELARSDEPYARRFLPIATRWRQVVANYVRKLAQEVELRQQIESPYVIAVPLTAQQEIFVGRTDIGARIEQLLLDRRCPPLLLYGQRRMGKTSLLNNLGRLLPSTIVPLFVDLQGPASQASDHAGFLYNIARGVVDSSSRQRDLNLPSLRREALASDPFTRFDEWLDQVEQALGQNTALLALDEFETLDRALAEGRLSEAAVLGMLRHLIQHRPRFKVLLAGSHTLEELQPRSGFLINAQVVHISYLKESETRQLVEWPVKDFALRYEPDASQRVLDLTRGHPALVQLLCAEIVALKNEQPSRVRRLACLADVEAAVPEALSHGSLFFADIQRNQVDAAGLALLRFLAAQGEGVVVGRETLTRQFPDDVDHARDLLLRRELIEQVDQGYRFQVELIRRWFAERDR